MNPRTVEAIRAMKEPVNSSQIKSVLGAAGYYQKFCQDYACVVKPLRDLDKQCTSKLGRLPYWGEAERKSFDAIKAMLATDPVLAMPKFDGRPMCIISDCSDHAMGAVLMQYDDEGVERPLAYYSRELTKAEKNYGISDREGLAVVTAARKWRALCHGVPLLVITDHQSLVSLTTKKELSSARQRRYAMDLAEFGELSIVHRAGALLHLPDMLSRLGYCPAMADGCG